MVKLAFDVFKIIVDSLILDIQELVSCHLHHYIISNLQSISVVLYYDDRMTSLSRSSIFSEIQAILAHNFCMKDVDLSFSFLHTLRPSQIHSYSLSNPQNFAHISSCLDRSTFATSSSILPMIQVVPDHNLFMKVEHISSSFP